MFLFFCGLLNVFVPVNAIAGSVCESYSHPFSHLQEVIIGAPSDGQALPAERGLLELMSRALPGGSQIFSGFV